MSGRAALETFVHLQPVDRRIRYVWFRVTIPADVSIGELASLPSSWRDSPPSEATQAAGTAWAKRAGNAVLRVPSILVPGEHNLLLNPQHPHFQRLKISKPEPFDIDGRLWKDGGDKRRPRTTKAK